MVGILYMLFLCLEIVGYFNELFMYDLFGVLFGMSFVFVLFGGMVMLVIFVVFGVLLVVMIVVVEVICCVFCFVLVEGDDFLMNLLVML